MDALIRMQITETFFRCTQNRLAKIFQFLDILFAICHSL